MNLRNLNERGGLPMNIQYLDDFRGNGERLERSLLLQEVALTFFMYFV